MGKLVCLMGKSSTGKDTIYKLLTSDPNRELLEIVLYTTRPIRQGEIDGREYHFVDEKEYLRLKGENRIIEERAYHTQMGVWRYFTVWDNGLNLEEHDYIMIGTLEAYGKLCDYLGNEMVIPVLIDLEDGVRLERALIREKKQVTPRYDEVCRRFLADQEDFSEEKISALGIDKRFYNDNLEQCVKEIRDYLRTVLDIE